MARIAALLPDCCELTAVSDPNENSFASIKAEFPQTAFFTSSDELLDSGCVQAVITEVPPAIHTEYVLKALEHGIHVLGEIPAVNSIEEGELLWKKVHSSKAMYMGAANPNYRAKTAFGLKLREMGLLGKIVYIETEYVHYTARLAGVQASDGWRDTYESCRYCTHSLGPVLELLGDDEFQSVCCMSTGDHLREGHSHNAMSSLLRTRKNVVVRFLAAFGVPSHGPGHTTKLFCEKGVIELYNEKCRLWLMGLNAFSSKNDYIEVPFTPTGADRPLSLAIPDEAMFKKAHHGHNGADNLMLRDFAESILNGKSSPIDIKKSLAMTLPGIYAAESAKEGGSLKQISYPWS